MFRGKKYQNGAKLIDKAAAYDVKEAMEEIDDLSQEFSFCRTYQSPENLKQFIKEFLNGASFSVVGNS